MRGRKSLKTKFCCRNVKQNFIDPIGSEPSQKEEFLKKRVLSEVGRSLSKPKLDFDQRKIGRSQPARQKGEDNM